MAELDAIKRDRIGGLDGGFTESGDAELADREMLAQGRHTTR